MMRLNRKIISVVVVSLAMPICSSAGSEGEYGCLAYKFHSELGRGHLGIIGDSGEVDVNIKRKDEVLLERLKAGHSCIKRYHYSGTQMLNLGDFACFDVKPGSITYIGTLAVKWKGLSLTFDKADLGKIKKSCAEKFHGYPLYFQAQKSAPVFISKLWLTMRWSALSLRESRSTRRYLQFFEPL